MNSTILKFGIFGLITGAILFLMSLLFGDSLSFGSREIFGYTTIVLALCFVYFGIKQYRDKEQDGQIKFGKAFQVGGLISIFVATGFALVDALYTTVINPTFMDDYKAQLIAQGHQGELPDWSTGEMALLMFVTVILIGIIISLVSALILKKEKA